MSGPGEIGTVYVAALNRWGTLAALGDALYADPYRAPPNAPVLQLKPANTWCRSGDPIVCPVGASALRMGAGVAMVVGTRSTRVMASEVPGRIAGYRLVNDVSVPYQSHYRPAIKARCRDGFLPLGEVTPSAMIPTPDAIEVIVEINGIVRGRSTGEDAVRRAWQLVADVTQFITLEPGDLLLLGELADAPLAQPGDHVRIMADSLTTVANPIVAEPGATQ